MLHGHGAQRSPSIALTRTIFLRATLSAGGNINEERIGVAAFDWYAPFLRKVVLSPSDIGELPDVKVASGDASAEPSSLSCWQARSQVRRVGLLPSTPYLALGAHLATGEQLSRCLEEIRPLRRVRRPCEADGRDW